MRFTQNLNMKIPEGGDPIDIADITGNFETLDEEVNKKASSSGGDISNTTIKTVDTIATEFPVPSAGESSKTFLGKVRKFIQDFVNIKDTLLTLSKLVNNGQTTSSGFALDARYGKTLYDLYAQLNTDLASGIIQIGGIKYQLVVTSFLVPTQTSATVFNVSDKIPNNASIAYCMQQNATNSPVVIGTFRASGNKWTILTDVTNAGNFSVRAFYLIPL